MRSSTSGVSPLAVDFPATHETLRGSSAMDIADPNTPESIAVSSETASLLSGCVGGLTERHRQLIEMRYEQDMTLAHIAQVFGVSVPAVHAMHALALDRLRTSLSLMGIERLAAL
jgi:RNA polymerase sigma factor (sigma-70 family)